MKFAGIRILAHQDNLYCWVIYFETAEATDEQKLRFTSTENEIVRDRKRKFRVNVE